MFNAANYSATEILRNGRRLEVRAFKSEDRADFVTAADRTGPLTRYRRFFTLKTNFSEREKNFFLNVDFHKHVALIALMDEGGRQVIVAAGRYIVMQPLKAEVAFTVIDQYQGQGDRTGAVTSSRWHCSLSGTGYVDCRGPDGKSSDAQGV
jgi:hypothetical protein